MCASATIPVFYNPLPVRGATGERLAMDGMLAGGSFELGAFGEREVVTVLNVSRPARVPSGRMDLLDAVDREDTPDAEAIRSILHDNLARYYAAQGPRQRVAGL